MPSWDETKKMVDQAQTPDEKAEAARALNESIKQEHRGKTITLAQGNNSVVNLGNLPEAMKNPETYDIVKKVLKG